MTTEEELYGILVPTFDHERRSAATAAPAYGPAAQRQLPPAGRAPVRDCRRPRATDARRWSRPQQRGMSPQFRAASARLRGALRQGAERPPVRCGGGGRGPAGRPCGGRTGHGRGSRFRVQCHSVAAGRNSRPGAERTRVVRRLPRSAAAGRKSFRADSSPIPAWIPVGTGKSE